MLLLARVALAPNAAPGRDENELFLRPFWKPLDKVTENVPFTELTLTATTCAIDSNLQQCLCLLRCLGWGDGFCYLSWGSALFMGLMLLSAVDDAPLAAPIFPRLKLLISG